MADSQPSCPQCASVAFARDDTLRSRPSVLAFLLFGWLSLLASYAFKKREVKCQACGHYFKIRTPGSILALAVLIILLVCLATSLFLHW